MYVPKRNRYLVIKIENIFINNLASPKTRFSLLLLSLLSSVCVAGQEGFIEETKTDVRSWLQKHVYRPSVVVLT